jgi:hypothetical protein
VQSGDGRLERSDQCVGSPGLPLQLVDPGFGYGAAGALTGQLVLRPVKIADKAADKHARATLRRGLRMEEAYVDFWRDAGKSL